MAPKLYMVDGSPPVRATLMLAKALNIELEHVQVDVWNLEHLSEEYMKKNPQHTIPTLVDDGHYIWDSHAINLYLIEKYAKETSLYPKDIYTRAKINQRLFFDAEIVFTLLKSICAPLFKKERQHIPEELISRGQEVYTFLEKFLENDMWMVGNEVTLADLTLITTVTSLHCIVPINEKYNKLHDWINRTKALTWYSENVQGLDHFKTVILGFMGKKE